MITYVWEDSYQLMEEKRQKFTIKVDAAHSSRMLVGPACYVSSQKGKLRKLDAVIFMLEIKFDLCFVPVKYVYFIVGVGIATRLGTKTV
jgi:hypothetical protein